MLLRKGIMAGCSLGFCLLGGFRKVSGWCCDVMGWWENVFPGAAGLQRFLEAVLPGGAVCML